jgi:gamma-D-glutamyl-L-lysine dipeptidyl-peptidase
VAVRAQGAAALPVTGGDVVRTAQMFDGLPYLWAGRSGFGFDCSGLASLDLHARGVIIPRDADAQALKGTEVAEGDLRPGDLLFYATDGQVHHVSIYAGDGLMVQSPRTGSTVQTIAVSTPAYAREFAGARRAVR